MKLSRMLATATMCSALSFGAAGANAKSGSKAGSSSSAKPADTSADADDANGAADDNAGDSSTTTTTTTTTTNPDDSAASPSGDSAAGTNTTATPATPAAPDPNAPAADTAMPPAAAPSPESPAMPPPPMATGSKVVFLPIVSSSERAEHGYQPPLGVVVSAGGGAFDFVGGDIKARTGMGGFWTVRALLGSRSIVGLEGAYIGTAQSIQSLGLQNDARLLSNGVEGTLRINAPVAVMRFLVEPFAFAGAGWSHYNVVNTNTNSASVRNNDDVITLPVGGGLAMGYAGFYFDARFTYRFSYDNDLVALPVINGGMDNWNVGGNLGFEF